MVRYENFDHIDDFAELEAIETELWDLEETNPDEAKKALLRLYKRMWKLRPGEIRFERSIAQLYLELGCDLKERQANYREARSYFEELIKMKEPVPVPIAHYRLGFIHYYEKRWMEAIKHFNRAISGMDPRKADPVEAWARLDESQLFKAHVRLAMAYKQRMKEVVRKARALYAGAVEREETNRPFHQELDLEIGFEEEEEKPYACDDGSQSKLLNGAEFDRIRRLENAVVFDDTGSAKYLHVSGVPHKVGQRMADLLRFLLKNRSRPVASSELRNRLRIDQPEVTIKHLRDFLQDCGLDSTTVATVRGQGYRCTHPCTYWVCDRNDPVRWLEG